MNINYFYEGREQNMNAREMDITICIQIDNVVNFTDTIMSKQIYEIIFKLNK